MLKLIHKLTRQYFKDSCRNYNAFRLKVLECIVNHLVTYSSDYFELIDQREDTFLYDRVHTNERIPITKLYVLRDKYSKMYLYFFCTLINNSVSSPQFTMSKGYDSKKNLKNQVGIPVMSDKCVAVASANKVPVYSGEYYGFTVSLLFSAEVFGDFYFITKGRSFAFFIPQSFGYMGKYGNEVSSYFIYDVSNPYHVNDSRIVSVHSSRCCYYRLSPLQAGTFADVTHFHSPESKYVCLGFVAGDSFDTGISGYYINDANDYANIDWQNYRKHTDYDYTIVTDDSLSIPSKSAVKNYNRRKDDLNGTPHQYEELDPKTTCISMLVSYFDGYTARREYGTPTATEIMYRSNTYIPYSDLVSDADWATHGLSFLDLNSGTNYYSGMLSTLNSSTIAIPNFVSILREPDVLGNMSPVQESNFMYLLDMSKIETGESVEVVDNSGNTIKLICFPASAYEIKNPGEKMFGVGIRLD